jgi:hypothetical protein
MDAVSMDGNLQQLAAMVRGTNRRPDSAAPADRSAPDKEKVVPPPASTDLPDSAKRIAGGLSKEDAEPLREEKEVDTYMQQLALQIDANPSLALMAQGGVRQGSVLAMV